MARKKVEALFAPAPFVQCQGLTICDEPAKYRIRINGVWVPVCVKCYGRHFANVALGSLDQHGLAKLPQESEAQWAARMREFCRNGIRSINQRNRGR